MRDMAGRLGSGVLVAMLLLGAGCGGSAEDAASDGETAEAPTRAQRDSAIAESAIPGAGAVGTALDAAAAAETRAQEHDTIS